MRDAIIGLVVMVLVLCMISPWLLLAVVIFIVILCVALSPQVSREPRRMLPSTARGQINFSNDRTCPLAEWKSGIVLSEGEEDVSNPVAARLIRDKPLLWEFLLAEELLTTQLRPIRSAFNELRNGYVPRSLRPPDEQGFLKLAREKTNQLASMMQRLLRCTSEELIAAWGPPGVAGNAPAIVQAVSNLVGLCEELLRWERDVRSVAPPSEYFKAHRMMFGWAEGVFNKIKEMTDKLTNILADPPTQGHCMIRVNLDAPSNIETVEREIRRIGESKQALADNSAVYLLLGALTGIAAYNLLEGDKHNPSKMDGSSLF
jgi:hypothetical protein